MDVLVEQVVKRQKNAKYYLNIVIILFAMLAIPSIFVLIAEIFQLAYFIYIALFVFFFCIYGAWYFISSLSIEYEYAILGSTFRVDKIIAKRKRKKVLKIDVKEFESVFKYTDEEMDKYKFTKVYSVGEKDFSTDNYVARFYSEAKGKCAIVFTPKEKLLNAMRPYLNRETVKNIFSV